jgi:ankyrin repeat protein
MLQCLVVAAQPLRVEELAELLALEFDPAPGGIPKYRPALRLDDQTQAVLSTCSSLVTIIDNHGHVSYGRSQIVQFSHFSVKEFLVSHRLSSSPGDISRYHIRLGSAHTVLTQACLGLLLHSNDHVTAECTEGSPLTEYAARHWVEHALFEDVASRVKDGIERLFDLDKPHFDAWLDIYDIYPQFSGWHDPDIRNPLYYSVLCGFYDLVQHLAIKHPDFINVVCGEYQFPLLAALAEGHAEVAELLLEHGADVNVRDATGMPMLHVALSWFHYNNTLYNVVKFLLNHGADVNARDNSLRSSLHLAGCYGLREIAQVLLEHKADVNSQDQFGRTPLHMVLGNAPHFGMDVEMSNNVWSLLEHGTDANRRCKDNQAPRLVAINWEWFRTARILLEHGADANAENNDGMAPLHILSEGAIDDGDVLNLALLLLTYGAQVNRRGKDNVTPLHLAIRGGQFKLAAILIEHGADSNAENDNGETPLRILSECRRNYDEGDFVDHARLLLEHGVRAKQQDVYNKTSLLLGIGKWIYNFALLSSTQMLP